MKLSPSVLVHLQPFPRAGHTPKTAKHEAPAPHLTLICSHHAPGWLHSRSLQIVFLQVFRLSLCEKASTFCPRVFFKLYVYSITLTGTYMCLETSGNGAAQPEDMDPLQHSCVCFPSLYFKDLPQHQMARELEEDYIFTYARSPYVNHVRNQEVTKINRTLPSSFNGPLVTTLTAVQIPIPMPVVH